MKSSPAILGTRAGFIQALFADHGPQQVARWVEELPWYDPVGLIDQLEMPVNLLEGYPVSPPGRLAFVEALVGTLRYAKEALDHGDDPGDSASPADRRATAGSLIRVLPGFIANYRRVIDEESRVGRIGHWLHKDAWPIAAHRLLTLTGLQLDAARVREEAPEAGLWQWLAELYSRVSHQGWINVPVTPVLAKGPPTSFDAEFRRILLLNMIPRGRGTPGARVETEGLMGCWVQALRPVLPQAQLPHHFRGIGLRSDRDAPPIMIALRGEPPVAWEGHLGWAALYRTDGLKVQLDFCAEAARASSSHLFVSDRHDISLDTLQLLRHCWLGEFRRREGRLPGTQESATLEIGFTSIHQTMEQARTSPMWQRIPNPPQFTELFKPGRKHYCNLPLPTLLTGVEGDGNRAPPPPVRGRRVGATLLDHSPHGMRVRLDPNGSFAPPVGQLLAVNVSGGRPPRLAEVRWAQASPRDTLAVGLSTLCEDPVAIMVRIRGESIVSEPVRAFAGADPDGRPILVLPPLCNLMSKGLEVIHQNRLTPVRLGESLAQTGYFRAYSFDMALGAGSISRAGHFARMDIEHLLTGPRSLPMVDVRPSQVVSERLPPGAMAIWFREGRGAPSPADVVGDGMPDLGGLADDAETRRLEHRLHSQLAA